jgi:hypothetical protein
MRRGCIRRNYRDNLQKVHRVPAHCTVRTLVERIQLFHVFLVECKVKQLRVRNDTLWRY